MKVNDQSSNPLIEIYSRFLSLPTDFRSVVELECNWSTPSFYRRMRSKSPVLSMHTGNALISKAEMDKIIQLALELSEDLVEFCEKYTKR